MAKGFRDYAEIRESMMEGFTVAKVSAGINAEGSGMMLELERQIDNITIGIDIFTILTAKMGRRRLWCRRSM